MTLVESKVESKAESIGDSCLSLSKFFAFGMLIVNTVDVSRFILLRDIYMVIPYYIPLCIVSVYFCMVQWHNHIRSEESRSLARQDTSVIKQALVVWNWSITLLSFIMFCGLSQGILRVVSEHGLLAYICDGELVWYGDTPLGFYLALFGLSKIPELLDTVFLVLRGRPVGFLHWYHHISVLLYCWLATITHYPGSHFAVINSFVHSVMYYYFTRMAQGVRPQCARLVTQIQLIQMVLGTLLNGVFFGVHTFYPSIQCNGGEFIENQQLLHTVFIFTSFMYGSYLILFGLFFMRRYGS